MFFSKYEIMTAPLYVDLIKSCNVKNTLHADVPAPLSTRLLHKGLEQPNAEQAISASTDTTDLSRLLIYAVTYNVTSSVVSRYMSSV